MKLFAGLNAHSIFPIINSHIYERKKANMEYNDIKFAFSRNRETMNPGHTSVAADHLFRFTPDIISSAFVCCFRVRVAQQRSPLAELLAEESKGGETRDSNFLEEEDHIFNWQEKVFGPFEIDFYADEKNCLTDCQKEYHRRINDEQLKGARLYSYTENDSYYIDDNLLTTPYR